ncbi:BMP1 [Cordylochernes scorpioides]|uniref:Metalloendopeptidase n=1 Tax=Cordylochernes scorpioides TaxID=51811 RepID=A0ABY6K876_9ARAC|nr:BMP1 [Cordylochernes scorpioides]
MEYVHRCSQWSMCIGVVNGTIDVRAGQEYNFNKLTEEEVDSLGLPYDYDSIMHYARNTFSKTTYLDTILPQERAGRLTRPEIGQRVRLSRGDISQTNLLYKCPKCGRTMQDPAGTLTVPTHVGSGPQHCEWRITGTHGERIVLNISEIDINDNCDTDYVEVRDGYWVRSPLLGEFSAHPAVCSVATSVVVVQASSAAAARSPTNLSPRAIAYWSPTSPWTRSPAGVDSQPTMKDVTAVCGGDVHLEEGILQSPNFPDDYWPEKECIWRISLPDSKYQVALKFHSFELENHDNCVYDYLEIRDGLELTSPLLGKFCGYRLPEDILSSASHMLVKFVSDSSVQKSGFSASFVKELDECRLGNHGCEHECTNTIGGFRCECKIGYELHSDGRTCEDACGGILDAENGTIVSPSFPDMYPPNKNCVWEVVAQPQYRITLNFTHFDLEGKNVGRPGPALCHPIEDVRSEVGSSNSAIGAVSTEVGSSNSAIGAVSTEVGSSNSAIGAVRTEVGSSNSAIGAVSTEVGSSNSAIGAVSTEVGSSNSAIGAVNTEVGSSNSAIGAVSTEVGSSNSAIGAVSTEVGSSNLDIGAVNTEVAIGAVNTEVGSSNLDIGAVNTEVGSSNSAIGAVSTEVGSSNSAIGAVNTEVGSSNSAIGAVSTEVGSSNEALTGGVPQQDCEYDSLEIRSRLASGEDRKHGVFCGSRLPPVLTSEGNNMRVIFTSDNSVQKSGFAAIFSTEMCTDKDECAVDNGGCQHICINIIGSYRCSCHNGFVLHDNKHGCKEGSCTHQLVTPVGEISTPNFPEFYPAKKECAWLFTTTPGHRIKLVFTSFELEPHPECAYDHIEALDGAGEQAPSLGRFCGSKLPHPLLASANKMYLIFKSDSSVQRKGFLAAHRTVCGGRLLSMSHPQHLYSHAKYGDHHYDNKEDCDWVVEAAHGHRVSLRFLTFELEQEQECSYDLVAVYDGGEESAPLLGRFCGNKLPPEVVSTGFALMLRFRTDDTITNKGFSAAYRSVPLSERPSS